MKMNGIKGSLFAALTAVSLAFGAAQAIAVPRGSINPSDACANYDPRFCQAMCGPGCGGTCINNECYCDC